MTRIALLSDLHGNLPAIEAVLNDLKTRQVERIFCLGDLISGPLWPKETIQFLMQQDWAFIRGNHDRCLVEKTPSEMGLSDSYARQFLNQSELDWLASLPATRIIDNTFTLCHGSPACDTTYLLENIENGRVRLSTPKEITPRLNEINTPQLLCGHSHTPRMVQLPNGLQIVNPGSVGVPAYEDDSADYFVVENGSPHARYAILTENKAEWQAEIILVAYDYSAAVEQARKNNRRDYVVALETGYLRYD